MAISPLVAARRLGEISDWSVSNLALQKILYIAHMIHLGRHGGDNPLLSERFEAWDYGPVLPSLYHRAKIFGSESVKNIFHGVSSNLPEKAASSIAEAYRITQGKTPGQLVAITHWDEGAWAKNYVPGKRGVVIPNKDIREEYERRVKRGG